MELNDFLPQCVEFMALAYHEGRNVSRLFHMNAASKHTFGRLAELPPDRSKAWEKLIPIQQESAAAGSAKEAAEVFQRNFGCSLEELGALFGNLGWRRAPGCGGQPWAVITKAVVGLCDAIDRKDEPEATKLLAAIPSMRHNTGSVKDKLARLKAKPR